MNSNNHVIIIIGPTASGKTDLGFNLAQRINAEIINADSRQVYRHMDIGTAKPSITMQKTIPHHEIDIIEPNEEYNLAIFLKNCKQAIAEIQKKSKIPIVVGGTGQYISALLEGWIVPKVPPDLNFRQSLEKELENNGSDALYQKLIKVAPLAAQRINPANSRRIIRALEIFHHNPGLLKNGPQKSAPSFSSIIIGIDSTKEFLLPRISYRIEQMLNDGLINEVQQLLNMGFGKNLPSMSGIGYKEVIDYLNQQHPYETMIEIMIKRTQDLVKRQKTWFNALESVNWIPITNEELSSAALELILKKI